jgi:hypothetical protein
MAKVSGLPSQLLVGIYDISGDTQALEIETLVATIDVTAINASAMERIVGRVDGSISWTGFWNVTAGQAHPVLSALPRTDVTVQWIGPGATASIVAKQITYHPSFNADGSITIAVNCLGNGSALEWGVTL